MIVILKNDHNGVKVFKISKAESNKDTPQFWYSNLIGNTEQEAINGGTDQRPYGFIDRQTVLNMIDALKQVLK